MSFQEKILKFAGKENFKLDNRIDIVDIFRLILKYGFMLLNGTRRALFYHTISNKIYIGRKVKLHKKNQIKIGRNTKIHNEVKIDALSTDGVSIGEKVVIGSETAIECTGSLQSIGKGISIGDSTTFGNNCYFGCAGGIEIGNDVVAGQFVRFHSENHNYNDLNQLIKNQGVTHKGIKIGNNCWIGAGAVFLDGAELGDGCVVGANALVTKKFENNLVIGGVPAKVIKKRGDNE